MKQDYNNLDSPYDSFLHRKSDLDFKLGEIKPVGGKSYKNNKQTSNNNESTEPNKDKGGSVEKVAIKNDGNATDFWIKSFIRSVSWKPKTVGFYINGRTGYAEFTNIFVSGTINATTGILGGFLLGADFIRDVTNTMGLASTVTGGDDVRFWAGDTFANRDIAPFRVYESGALFAVSGELGGFIMGSTYLRDSADTMGLSNEQTIGDDVRFWAGDTYANRDIAPFRVTESGTVVAEDIQIHGGSIDGTAVSSFSGIGPPNFVPSVIGQLYIDVDPAPIETRTYISMGTSLDSDWLMFASTGILRKVEDIGEDITISEFVQLVRVSDINRFDSMTITESVTISVF